MKKKTIFIYLNKTSLSHTQLLQKNFILELTTKFRVIIFSHFDLKNISFIKKLNIKCYKLDENLFKSLRNNKIFNFFREINLHITCSLERNVTLKNFNYVYLNQKKNEYNILKFYIFFIFWKIIQSILKYKIFQKIFQQLQIFFFSKKILDKYVNQYQPDGVIVSSPGWWDGDNFILYDCKRLGIKTLSIITSWDQPTGMGLMNPQTDRFIVWSEQMKKDLIEFHKIEQKKIIILGAIHWDHYFSVNNFDKKKFFKKNNLNSNQKVILICLKSPTRTNINDIKKFCQKVYNFVLEKKFQLVIRPHPIYYSERFFNQLEELKVFFSKKKNISIQNIYEKFDVKKNTISNFDKSIDIGFLVNSDYLVKKSSQEILFFSDVVINFFSTMNIEASILDKPIINFIYSKKINKFQKLVTKKNLYMDFQQNHIAPIINFSCSKISHNYQSLKTSLNAYLLNAKIDKKNRYNFLKYTLDLKGNSVKRISNYIFSFINEN